MADRFDKFTERARRVLTLAQEEAQRFNHNYIGTEHLLLGLVREGDGVAAKVLSNLGVDLNKVRSAVEFIIGRGDRAGTGEIGLTPRAKKVIELAVDEARRLNHSYIGTEHLLLGLVREGEGIAARRAREPRREPRAGARRDHAHPGADAAAAGRSGGRAALRQRTPTLDQLGVDLTAAARSGQLDPVVGREIRDRAGRADPLAAHQEQPGADRRAGRRQDRRSPRGWRSASSRRRHPGHAAQGKRHR